MENVNQQGTTRRSVLRAGAMAGTAVALGATGIFAAGTAHAAGGTRNLPYPSGVTDTSHCTPEVAALIQGVFTAKSRHDAAGFMSYFSTANTVYIDACLGVAMSSWKDLNDFFTPFLALIIRGGAGWASRSPDVDLMSAC